MTQIPNDIAVIMPAYNETATITKVIRAVLKYTSQLIVINDGSSDDTLELIKSFPVTLINHDVNKGKGVSLIDGLKKAKEMGYKAVITIDADGQHFPEDLPRMVAAYKAHEGHVIMASRLRETHRAPRMRLFANRVSDFFISWAAGQKIFDTQSGFRLYPLRAMDVILSEIQDERFSFETDVLLQLSHDNIPFASIKIHSCYPEDRRGSHYRNAKDTWDIAKVIGVHLVKRAFNIPGLIHVLTKPGKIHED